MGKNESNSREKETTQELLERACPSIQYRLRFEVLNQPRTGSQMLALQDKIRDDQAVKEVFKRYQPDSWLGRDFQGYISMESGIRLLCEKGVDAGHPILSRALQALQRDTDRLQRGTGKAGIILDEMGFGGTEMIRAALFAQAGWEEEPHVQEQIGRLRELLETGNGWFSLPLSHRYFRTWGAYTGLMLERDWRDPRRRAYDLTFRSLLILHHAESGEELVN